MSKDFLVKRILDDGVINELMTGNQLGDYINMSDCHDEQYMIYYVRGGVVHRCEYKGWQPGNKIEVVDFETGEIVLSYIGEDH